MVIPSILVDGQYVPLQRLMKQKGEHGEDVFMSLGIRWKVGQQTWVVKYGSVKGDVVKDKFCAFGPTIEAALSEFVKKGLYNIGPKA